LPIFLIIIEDELLAIKAQ